MVARRVAEATLVPVLVAEMGQAFAELGRAEPLITEVSNSDSDPALSIARARVAPGVTSRLG